MGINDYIKVGSLIKELRLSRGYSAKEFAKKLQIPYSTYSNYENNNREPSLDTLHKICDNLGVTVEELFRFATLPSDLKDAIVDALIENDVVAVKNKLKSSFYSAFDPSEFSEDELADIKQYIEFIKFKRNTSAHGTTE
jgi:transcriptional regulator with XRE-family HTH domain